MRSHLKNGYAYMIGEQTMDLKKLLKPKSIAVIGASEREGFGGDACRNILKYMNDLSRVYFVHPTRETVFDRKCYHNIENIEDTIDLAIICTSKKIVNDNLRSVALKGCHNAVVFASGYRETGKTEDKEAEKELIALCKELDIHLVGPNCGGFVNYIDDVQAFAFVVGDRERKGNVGLISQSGQICISLMDSPGIKFSYLISAGNCSVISMEDYFDFLVDDPDTKVVSLYLEGVTQIEKFINSLKKAALKRKPVIVLKTGRSEKGTQIASSHTGSLAGSDKTYDAIFKKFGVIRVNDMQELLSTSQLLSSVSSFPNRANVSAMNTSGGETAICADVGSLFNINYPDFKKETVDKLRGFLPSYGSVNNPLDMTASIAYDTQKFAGAMKAILDDENIDILLIGLTIPDVITDTSVESMTKGIELVRNEGYSKPIVIIPNTEGTRNNEYLERLNKVNIPVLPPQLYAFTIIKYFIDFISYKYSEKSLEIAIPSKKENENRISLSEHESKMMLKESGIKIPDEKIAKDVNEAKDFAQKYGYPLVMKIESPDILHKSDAGGVFLNINNETEIEEAFGKIMKNAKDYNPNAKINGILMQKMLEKGVEVIVGISSDKQFGPMIMVGLGGVFVEIFKDVSLYPVPVNKAEAKQMIAELKAYKLLNGYRGSKVCDIEALEDFIVKVSDFAFKNKDIIAELDLNPLFVYENGKGVNIADALIIKK